MLRIYANNSYKRRLLRQIKHQYMRAPSIEHYTNAIIVNEHVHGFGIFDENLKFVKSSCQVRRNNGQFIPKFNHENIPYVDEDVVFIGNVYPQFGHFLLEHMNRAYALLDKKYQKMKVVLINNMDVNPVPNYMFELLGLLGVKRENIIILNKTTRFKNVFVPVQCFNIPVYSSYVFGKTYDKIAKNIKSTKDYSKIYVSRTAMKERRTYGEEAVQEIFEKNGYKIIWPETMPLQEQIAYIKNCKVLAGCAGTALHLALFMKPGGTVIQIKRNMKNKDNADTQYLINETKGLNSIFISASVEKKPTDHGTEIPQIIGVNDNIRHFFDDYDFVYDKKIPILESKTYQEYQEILSDYVKRNGDATTLTVKNFIVRITACFIPGRERRGKWRNWLKARLNIP